MNNFYISAAETGTLDSTIVTEQKPNKIKPTIICGACGAVENEVDDNKTECPNCDEYIY